MRHDPRLSQQYPAALPPEPSLIEVINAYIAHRLVECRRSRHLTQEDLGRRIGVAGSKIARYENCSEEISARTLFKLAGALMVSFEYFYAEMN
jgi:DNA-binding XRE family transcriptional regulator